MAERADPAERLEVGILKGVVDALRTPEQPGGQGSQAPVVAADELGERVVVTALHPLDQGSICGGWLHGPHPPDGAQHGRSVVAT